MGGHMFSSVLNPFMNLEAQIEHHKIWIRKRKSSNFNQIRQKTKVGQRF